MPSGGYLERDDSLVRGNALPGVSGSCKTYPELAVGSSKNTGGCSESDTASFTFC